MNENGSADTQNPLLAAEDSSTRKMLPASGTMDANVDADILAAPSPDGGDGFAGDDDGDKVMVTNAALARQTKSMRMAGCGSPIVNSMNKNEYNWGKTVHDEGKKGLRILRILSAGKISRNPAASALMKTCSRASSLQANEESRDTGISVAWRFSPTADDD